VSAMKRQRRVSTGASPGKRDENATSGGA
jgi:hypothetical protein